MKTETPNGRCGHFSDRTNQEVAYRYQLDDSTAKKLDDRPFPFCHIAFVYFNILDVALLNKVSNLLKKAGVILVVI